jgi:hypothetical protein
MKKNPPFDFIISLFVLISSILTREVAKLSSNNREINHENSLPIRKAVSGF